MHFNKLKSSVCALALAVGLAGCAQQTYWLPGPHQDASNFGEVSGQCKMVAMGTEQPTNAFAYGSPQFVGEYMGAVAVAGAIGNAVRSQNAYSACMEGRGFVQSASPDQRMGQIKQSLAQGRACKLALHEEPVYASLQPHFLDLQTGRFTPAQLADTNIPTPAEVQLLTQYVSESRACAARTRSEVVEVAPALGPALEQMTSDSEAATALMLNRQLTWGEYAKRTMQISDAFTAKVGALKTV